MAFKTSLSNIPANIPYLKADLQKSLSWKEKLGEKTKARVGLVWSGGIRPNQPASVNKRRNIPLSKLAPLKHPNIDFYSLQKGQPGELELGELKRGNWNGPEIIDFSSQLSDFSDTAALMENLDLLITVDTSTAHLAGALGKPVWILTVLTPVGDGFWSELTAHGIRQQNCTGRRIGPTLYTASKKIWPAFSAVLHRLTDRSFVFRRNSVQLGGRPRVGETNTQGARRVPSEYLRSIYVPCAALRPTSLQGR